MSTLRSIWGENPDSLLDSCIKVCLENLHTFCEYDAEEEKIHGLRRNVYLSRVVCERMIHLYSEEMNKPINDNFLRIFSDSTRTKLRYVNLRKSEVTDVGMTAILQHPLVELDITGCFYVTNKTLTAISNVSSELNSLSVSWSTFPMDKNLQTFDLSTPNLLKLGIHGLCLSSLGVAYFEHLLKPLTCLTHLDLSECRLVEHFSALVPLKKQLVSLKLFDVTGLEDALDSICQLTSLRKLDISKSNYRHECYRFGYLRLFGNHYNNPNEFLRRIVESLPNLMHLDISGTNLAGNMFLHHEDGNPRDKEIPGLKSRVGRPLEFLGLMHTIHDTDYRKNIPARRIAGTENEDQILTAGEVYFHRYDLLLGTINRLSEMVIQGNPCSKPHLSLDLVLRAMQHYSDDRGMQKAGNKYLLYVLHHQDMYYLTRKIRRKMVTAVLNFFHAYRWEKDFIKDAFEFLAYFTIPQDVPSCCDFRFICSLMIVLKQLMEIDFSDGLNMSASTVLVWLQSLISRTISRKQKERIGQEWCGIESVMGCLLKHHDAQIVEMSWSILSMLTDKVPENCETFLQMCGLKCFIECLKFYQGHPNLFYYVMEVLVNVVRVNQLRKSLMKGEYLQQLSELLDSGNIQFGYRAAEVLVHILADRTLSWNTTEVVFFERKTILARLVGGIERWKLNTVFSSKYTSLEYILCFLLVDHTPEVQHWTVWVLANLIQVHPDKYCSHLISNGGLNMLKKLVVKEEPYQRIKELATMAIQACENCIACA